MRLHRFFLSFLGEEYIQRVEMFYCAVCHKYLPRTEPKNAADLVQAHCASAAHRLAYITKRKQEQQVKVSAEAFYEFILH